MLMLALYGWHVLSGILALIMSFETWVPFFGVGITPFGLFKLGLGHLSTELGGPFVTVHFILWYFIDSSIRLSLGDEWAWYWDMWTWMNFAAALSITISWVNGFRSDEVFHSSFEKSGIPHTRMQWSLRTLACVFLPVPSILGPDVKVKKNILYKTVNGKKKLWLDLLVKSDGNKQKPLFMYIHGGGWVLGERFQSAALQYSLAQAGWAVATIDYRLSPRNPFPDHIVDCKSALLFLKENCREYGINPNIVVVGGDSAGGHLSSLFAFSPNDPQYQPDNLQADTSVNGVIDIFGVHDFTDCNKTWQNFGKGSFVKFISKVVMQKRLSEEPEAFRRASPYWRLDEFKADGCSKDAPLPFVFGVHGKLDYLVPELDSEIFMGKYASVKAERKDDDVKSVYTSLPYARHSFNTFISPRAITHAHYAIEWLHCVKKHADGTAHGKK